MPIDTSEITPEKIRSIRRKLGLTQVEAGKMLGGGPRGFTKYEAGIVRPAASVVNLLRLLDADPGMLRTLVGRKTPPMTDPETGPFTVSGEHIAAHNERTLPELLRHLLSLEAQEHAIPASAIHVASRIHTPDGGEDGRIAWTGPPDRTPFLPGRLCQFQLKAGKISPADAGRDVLNGNGEVKPLVRSAIEAGGHYIVLCAHRHVQREIQARKERIRDAIRNAGLTVDDSQIDFRDADQIAAWVNRHPAVATSVRKRIQPGLVGPFRSWSHWDGRREHDDSPWIEDERLAALRGDLRKSVAQPRSVVRVVGLSGVGKTRLVLEAIRPADDDDPPLHSLSDLVLYAVESEVGAERMNETVQSLADTGNRAIVVIDECAPETHRSLSNTVLRRGSSLSLVTIDHEPATGTHDQKTVNVAEAPYSVTETIIDRIPHVRHREDQLRLARFCRGFPKIATRVGQAWGSVPMARVTDDDLIDSFVLGRRPRDRALLLKSAGLLATFGLVYREPPAASQLGEIARLGRSLEESDLRVAVDDLCRRGVAQSRGRAVFLQPRPIATSLAERQWQEWIPADWDNVLAGDISADLRTSAAEQLALLNTTETARLVTGHVCRPDGPFDGFARLSRTANADVLSRLADVDPAIVAERIERSLDDVDDLTKIEGDIRRYIVWALEKIAFDPRTFKDGARLLLRLATAENESISNNATGQFTALFPVFLGSTAADGNARLSLLDEVEDTADVAKCVVIVEALGAGSETHHFVRFASGAEAPGSRPAFESWRPATEHAAFSYITGCVTRLVRFATRTDRSGATGRYKLAEQLRSLVSYGFIDAVETAVDQVLAAVDRWPEALEALGNAVVYDSPGMDPDLTNRVRTLIAKLQPKSLESRVRFLVTDMPWDYPCDEKLDFKVQEQRKQDDVRALARDLVTRPTVLAGFLPQLSQGDQRMAFCFGQAIAESSPTPLQWLEPMIAAVSDVPDAERNHSLLSGLVVGSAKRFPKDVAAVKERAARSPALAPALPQICWQLGITSSDIALVLQAFNERLLRPFQLALWRAGGVLTKVPAPSVRPLIDAMLVHSAEGFAVAVELMGMYAHGMPDKLDGFRPQIRTAAANATRWNAPQGHQIAEYHFEKIMSWQLSKGRDDPHARSTALALARALVDVDGYHQKGVINPVVPKLLSGFPEIAWPLVGQAIVSDRQQAWRFQHLLGNVHSFKHRENPPILNLPEDSLFAWCQAHLERAPKFVASILPFLTTYQAGAADRAIHPVMARLLSEFGDRDNVLRAVELNICSYGWSGSLTNYYALYEQPLCGLVTHQRPTVRRWAKKMLRQLRAHIKEARNEDEEQSGSSEAQ